MDDLIRVCMHCGCEVVERTIGTEGWSVCTGCETIEGDTEEITLEEYESRLDT